MSQRIITRALSAAASAIDARLGGQVHLEPIGPVPPTPDVVGETAFVATLSEGDAAEGEYLLGSVTPFEFAHSAPFELMIVGGDEEQRVTQREALLIAAGEAIAADPTLGGIVDWAELTRPDPAVAERYVACAAMLTLLYSAPTALG